MSPFLLITNQQWKQCCLYYSLKSKSGETHIYEQTMQNISISPVSVHDGLLVRVVDCLNIVKEPHVSLLTVNMASHTFHVSIYFSIIIRVAQWLGAAVHMWAGGCSVCV